MRARRTSSLTFVVTVLLLAALFVPAPPVQAQDTTMRDRYERAEAQLSWNLSGTLYRARVTPQWMDDDQFWYRATVADGTEFMFADPANGVRKPAFDHERLAATLDEALERDVSAFDLPFRSFSYVDGRSSIEFAVNGAIWQCDLSEYTCEETERTPDEQVNNSIPSPDGRYAAYTQDHNLWVRDLDTGEDIQLTTDGEEHYAYAINSQGWNRGDTPILKWSPDGRYIKTFQQDERNTPHMYLLRTTIGRPELDAWPYAVPGDADDEVPLLERVVIDVEAREVIRLDAPADHQRTSNCCGLTRGQDLADVEWSADEEALAYVSTSRDYSTVTLRLADPTTGAVRDVYEETDEPFFESNLASRGVPNWRVLHDSNAFIWFTRADGWGHLYLHDLETGERLNRITQGDWNVLDVLHVDEEARTLWFSAVGKEEGHDPYQRHFYRVDFDGTNLQHLTPEEGDHNLQLAPSGRYVVDARSTFQDAPVTVVRDARTGDVVLALETAETDALYATGWTAPEPFTVKARDGETDLYGVMYKPSDFDERQQYPVVVSIYPGPQTGSVGSRSFGLSGRGQAQALAELGFIVVQLDALGTPFRSKAFHTFWHGDMNDNGIPDQRAGLEQLAERHDWIDADRVGIYGHSGGGYATATALFEEPDFFTVGVSGAGNHDNRGYTYYWGEKYQGLLEEVDGTDTFENQANQLAVENLEGHLLISYGTLDDNVHPNMSLLVVNALIEHNKDFDLLVFPNRTHGYANEPYNLRRTWDYFVEHLLGEEPPREYDISR
jgi:dipeptidyl-peptidase 4